MTKFSMMPLPEKGESFTSPTVTAVSTTGGVAVSMPVFTRRSICEKANHKRAATRAKRTTTMRMIHFMARQSGE